MPAPRVICQRHVDPEKVCRRPTVSRAARARGWRECRDAACANADVVIYAGVADPTRAELEAFPETTHVSRMLGMRALCEKDATADWLKQGGDAAMACSPETWTLPCDASFDENEYFIVKPVDQRGGSGIRLVQGRDIASVDTPAVVQRYVSNVCTWRGAKFDLRLYVVLVAPREAFLVHEAMVRLCTHAYAAPTPENCDDLHMHLTNTSINTNSKFEMREWLDERFEANAEARREFLDSLGSMLGHVMRALSTPLEQAVHRAALPCHSFHVLGVDVLLDANLRPYLLEINANPSLLAPTPADWAIKLPVLQAAFDLISGNVPANVTKI